MRKLLKHGCKRGFINVYHIRFIFISTYNISFTIFMSFPIFSFVCHLPLETLTEV